MYQYIEKNPKVGIAVGAVLFAGSCWLCINSVKALKGEKNK